MSRILFLNQPTVGHLNTLRHIALRMEEDGHTVGFLMPGVRSAKTSVHILDTALSLPDILNRDGLSCNLIRPAVSTMIGGFILPYKSGYKEIIHAVRLFSSGIRYYTERAVEFVKEWRPDVLVTDFAFPATSLVSEITDTPYVVVYHSGLPFRGEGIPPFGSGLPIGTDDEEALQSYARKEDQVLRALDRRINRARSKYGLKPMAPDMLRRPYSPWLNLVASAAVAEAPRSNLTENTLFIGPCFGKRKEVNSDFPVEELQANKFKVYVSLGTVFNNKPEVFKKIMRALDTPDYQVIISAGGAYEALQRNSIAGNALIYKRVPQVELLPKVDLFISHGGNNSTNEALACGKPLIIMPVGGEQGDNASRVEYLGVGLRIDIKQFSEEQLVAKVEMIRTDSRFRDRVEEIMKRIGSTTGIETASRCIDWIARRRRPIERRGEIPLTVSWDDLLSLLGE